MLIVKLKSCIKKIMYEVKRMSNCKSFFCWVVKAGIAGIAAILCLSIVSYWYLYVETTIPSKTGVTDYTWHPNQRMAKMTEGIASVRMDSNGYNNLNVPTGGLDILLMGSSHMEAANVESDKNAGYIMNEILPYKVYNIGITEHTIYRCIKNLDAALMEYQPQNVIIETDRVNLDEDQMKQVIDGEMLVRKSKSFDTVLYYLSKYLPSTRAIYLQILWMKLASSSNNELNDAIETDEIAGSDYTAILNEFLSKAAASLKPDQHLLIVYQPVTKIDRNGSYISTVGEADVFREACAAHGIEFLDLSEAFEELYNTEHILAHGFINTAVGEGHMNEAGHRVFAEEVAEYIKDKWEEQ